MQAIGYKELTAAVRGETDMLEAVRLIQQRSRNYAKRQLTWFRRQNDAVWLYIDEENVLDRACELVREFLQQ